MITQAQKDNILKWVRDLETTAEPQTKSSLHRLEDSEFGKAGYCCLGRACVVMGIKEIVPSNASMDKEGLFFFPGYEDPEVGYPQHEWFLETFGISRKEMNELADLNDDSDYSFAQIAAFLRQRYLSE